MGINNPTMSEISLIISILQILKFGYITIHQTCKNQNGSDIHQIDI